MRLWQVVDCRVYLHSYLSMATMAGETPPLNMRLTNQKPSQGLAPRMQPAAQVGKRRTRMQNFPGRDPILRTNQTPWPCSNIVKPLLLGLRHTPSSPQAFCPAPVKHVAQQSHVLHARLRLPTGHLLLYCFLLLLLQGLRRAHLAQVRVLRVQY